MPAILLSWFDRRTGYRKFIDLLLLEHIPGGAKWRYVWGSCLAFVFTVQLITGLLLMTAYSPADSTAWGSVYFIQYQMDFGWLIRGLHHFGSQTMVVLLGLHMLQVVIAGAELPPREVNWWLGLGLLGAVLGLSLTGYLLPWDQKGYWATQVATNIAGNLPRAGPWLQKIIVGGPVYGNHTLTRFFTLHVGVLPPLVVVLIIAHLVVFRRHGVTAPANARGEGWFWPDQAFRDMLVSLVIFAIMLGLALGRHGQTVDSPAPAVVSQAAAHGAVAPSLYDRWAHAGHQGRGANLDAPADPSRSYPARPEWYFLFLFQLLKYFEGSREVIGTVVIPLAVGLLLFVIPLLGYGRMRRFGYGFGIVVIAGLLVGAASLTVLAVDSDRKARLFQQELHDADKLAHRAIQLAGGGIPPDGPINLLRHDPQTHGPVLFGQYCSGCHRYGSRFNTGAKASDLKGFGTAEWIARLVANPGSPEFFGRTGLTKMAGWVRETREGMDRKEKAEFDADIQVIARWLARHPRNNSPGRETEEFHKGLEAFQDRECINCHSYEGEHGTRIFTAPDFTGYGDAAWVRMMIMAPDHPLRYGRRNKMPAFRDLEGPAAEVIRLEFSRIEKASAKGTKRHATELLNLSAIDRELIIRWLTGDDRVVLGGEAIAP